MAPTTILLYWFALVVLVFLIGHGAALASGWKKLASLYPASGDPERKKIR